MRAYCFKDKSLRESVVSSQQWILDATLVEEPLAI